MTRPRRTIARSVLHIVALCALAAALLLLLGPHSPGDPFALWLMLFGTFRLYPPLFLIWIVRSSLSAPRDAVSGAARICGWAGICAASAGIVWMSGLGPEPIALFIPGVHGITWVCLLVANESARLAVRRGSRRPRDIAIGAFGLALGSVLALGPIRGASLDVGSQHGIGSVFAFVAPRPWVVVLCLAGLWLWVGLADRHPARPIAAPETPFDAGQTP